MIRRRHLVTLLVIGSGVGAEVTPRYLRGQTGDVRIEVGGSRSIPPAGVDAASSNYLTGAFQVDWTSAPVGVFGGVFAGISPDEEGGDFAAAMLGGRLTSGEGPVSASITAMGTGFRVGAPFIYRTFTGILQPEVRFRMGGGAVLALMGEGGTGETRIEFRRGDVTREATTDLRHVGGGAELRVASSSALFTLGGAAFKARGERYSKGEFQVILALPAGGQIHGELAYWDLPLGSETTGQIRVTVPVGRWFAQASGGRSSPDPLLRTEAGDQAWISVGRVLKQFGSAPRIPLITLEPNDGGAIVHFRIERAQAGTVEVIGDFTEWEALPMTRDAGSRWTISVEIPAGTHHFGFLIDGSWFVPDTAPGRVADDWGQLNATIVVQ